MLFENMQSICDSKKLIDVKFSRSCERSEVFIPRPLSIACDLCEPLLHQAVFAFYIKINIYNKIIIDGQEVFLFIVSK